jgi:hypothetical protein
MSARCKALCRKTHFHYGFVTNFSRQFDGCAAMLRSFGAARMAGSQGTAIVQFIRRTIGPTEDPTLVNED